MFSYCKIPGQTLLSQCVGTVNVLCERMSYYGSFSKRATPWPVYFPPVFAVASCSLGLVGILNVPSILSDRSTKEQVIDYQFSLWNRREWQVQSNFCLALYIVHHVPEHLDFFRCLPFCSCFWPTALKLDCITNFDMLFLVMGFISLVDEIQFMLISLKLILFQSLNPIMRLKNNCCKNRQRTLIFKIISTK